MKGFFLLLFCSFTLPGYCQVAAIQNDKQNFFYLCEDNPLTIAVSGCSPKKLIVTTDNGVITGNNSSFSRGHYIIHPQHIGPTNISIWKKTTFGQKKIGSGFFYVKRLPLQIYFNGHNKWSEKLDKLTATHLLMPIRCGDTIGADSYFPATHFKVTIQRGKKEIYTRSLSNPKGARIDSVTNYFFTTLKNDDKVLFTDIAITDCDGTLRHVDSMSFTITGAEKYKQSLTGKDEMTIDPITGEEVKRSTLYHN